MKQLLFFVVDPIASVAASFFALTRSGVYDLMAQIPNPTAETIASGGSTAVLAGVVWLIAVKFQGGQDLIVQGLKDNTAAVNQLPRAIADAMKEKE